MPPKFCSLKLFGVAPFARAARASAWFAVNSCVTLKARSITSSLNEVFISTVPNSRTPGLDGGRRIASAGRSAICSPAPATVPRNSPAAENCLIIIWVFRPLVPIAGPSTTKSASSLPMAMAPGAGHLDAGYSGWAEREYFQETG